ncbi:MAG: hypothetical protein V4640_13200 [Verrucomicrobiota bacterium]
MTSVHLDDLRETLPATSGVEWLGRGKSAALRLMASPASPSVTIRCVLPAKVPVEGLHLRYRVSAHDLVPGAEVWENGRFMIEWFTPAKGGEVVRNPIDSASDNKRGTLASFVILSPGAPAIPAVRVENIGKSGTFELSDLEITAISERAWWRSGRWFLAAAWLVWATSFTRTWSGISRGRAVAAAALWVFLGVHFVIPGPWKIQRPLVAEFQLGSPALDAVFSQAANPGRDNVSAEFSSGATEALGKMPDQGSFPLRLKHAVTQARPLLHILLLFAPSLAFFCLVRREPALFLAISFALSIELAQIAFGYGFGWDDVFDFGNDALGIALALFASERIKLCWSQKRSWGLARGDKTLISELQ